MFSDPFAFLRANASEPNEAGNEASDTSGTADMFAGSEPVAPTAAPVEPVTIPASVTAPVAPQAATPGDIVQEALLALDERVRAVEKLLRQNGWAL